MPHATDQRRAPDIHRWAPERGERRDQSEDTRESDKKVRGRAFYEVRPYSGTIHVTLQYRCVHASRVRAASVIDARICRRKMRPFPGAEVASGKEHKLHAERLDG